MPVPMRLRNVVLVGAALAGAAITCAAAPETSPRQRLAFNADWRFHKGDVENGQGAIDDAGWRRLDLPHDWGIEGPFDQDLPGSTGKLPYFGVGWYRKRFDVDAAERGLRFYLDVDGAMSHAQVWLNGQLAGG